MKVNIPHDLRSFVHWFFLRTVCNKARDAGVPTDIKSVPGWDKVGFQDVDIKLTINGVECDFMETIMSLDKELDRMILEKAQELIRDQVGSLQDTINSIERTALVGVAKMAIDLGVELRERDW
jgi:hypothetical protein